jgi:hypothetical protein
VILRAGVFAGVLDILAAIVFYTPSVAGTERMLQAIASAALGTGALRGGVDTAAVGLMFHFTIAISWAAVFFFASGQFRLLRRAPFLVGPLYGVFVYWFMQLVVLPLSTLGSHPQTLHAVLVGMVIHMFCVGSPIVWTIDRLASP